MGCHVTPAALGYRTIVYKGVHTPNHQHAKPNSVFHSLPAAEVYPTDVRATFQGLSAAWGKVGAIIADVVFGYVNQQTTFYLSAAFGLVGCLVTILFLPDTTGLSLDELDRMAKYMITEEFEHYHGEAVNPR